MRSREQLLLDTLMGWVRFVSTDFETLEARVEHDLRSKGFAVTRKPMNKGKIPVQWGTLRIESFDPKISRTLEPSDYWGDVP